VLAYLDFHGLIEFWEDFGARDYSVSSAQLTEEGHFFANEEDPAA
jgi:hypothetical protein